MTLEHFHDTGTIPFFYLIAVSSDNSSRTKVGKLLGRAGDLIWSNFDTKYNGHKVISNKCKICKVAVSARARRMKSHVMTCKNSIVASRSSSCPAVPVSAANTVPVSAVGSISVIEKQLQEEFLHQKISGLDGTNKIQTGIKNFVKIIGGKAKDELDKALGKFLFSGNISFNILENKEFKNFVNLLNPAYTVPSHDRIGSTVLDAVYKEVWEIMEKELEKYKWSAAAGWLVV